MFFFTKNIRWQTLIERACERQQFAIPLPRDLIWKTATNSDSITKNSIIFCISVRYILYKLDVISLDAISLDVISLDVISLDAISLDAISLDVISVLNFRRYYFRRY